MGSFFHLTFYLIFFDYFYFIYLLFYFVQFLFLVILFSSYSFSFLNFSYSFSSLFNFFLFHFVFWNETKWKPRGREMTQRLKKHDGWRQQQYVRLNNAKKSHILLAPYEMSWSKYYFLSKKHGARLKLLSCYWHLKWPQRNFLSTLWSLSKNFTY